MISYVCGFLPDPSIIDVLSFALTYVAATALGVFVGYMVGFKKGWEKDAN